MILNSHKPDVAVRLPKQNLAWASQAELNSPQQEFQANTWVQLLELKSTFSFDEALLLCQISENHWVAWIPDCGEAVLHTSEFSALC